jgi:hypothetical protein
MEYLLRQYNGITREFGPTLKKYKNSLESYKRNLAWGSISSTQRPPAPKIPERVTLTEHGLSVGDTNHYRLVSPIYHQGTEYPPPQEDNMQMSNPRNPPQMVGLDWARVTVWNWP